MPQNREDFVDAPFEAPEGDLEQAVAEIMASVLDVDRIGRDDSFYDFSGTSLQAIRVCARVESTLGLKALPLWLFENDVVSDFAAELRGRSDQAGA
jgi:hypothetical protein